MKTTSIAHGVHAWYAPSDTVPVVDVQLSFEGAGSSSDPEGKGGRAALAAAMLTEGAGPLDARSFQRALDDHAITIEAQTDDDRLTIHIHCLREDAEEAGRLLALALGQPQLNEADAVQVKGQIGSLLAQLEESPEYEATRLLEKRAFAGHPYANAPYGSAASLAGLSTQDVRDYLKTYVTRGNLLIAAAGDVDSGLLDTMLTPMLDGLSDNDSGPVAVTQVSLQGGGEILHQAMDVPQSAIAFAAPDVARNDPRFYTAYLLNQILGGNALVSRLSNQLRQQQGLAYNIGTELELRRGTAYISGTLATRNGGAEDAVSAVKSVLATVRDKGVTAEECADAKSYVLGAFALQLDSSSAVAAMLLQLQSQHLDPDYFDKRQELFTRVSCADINSLAGELLDPQRFLIAVVGGTSASPASGVAIPTAPMGGSDTR